jgi:hypothetical protein
MEKTGNILDGSAFSHKIISRYQNADMELLVAENKDGEKLAFISLKKFPMIKFIISYPSKNNAFSFISLEYLAGNIHGWNEFSLQLLGEGNLYLGEIAVLENIQEIETIQITGGRIQRFDTRITGEQALTALRNRHERITALVEWMKNWEKTAEESPAEQTIDSFDRYWRPVLFPEITPARLRARDWKQEGDNFQRAEDINWNTGYTERIFSEELWPVRNSGTLLRDWEEALSQIYLEYEWENIIKMFTNRIIFNKIK